MTDRLLDFLFVPRCAACGERMDKSGDGLCDACRRAYEHAKDEYCDFCGMTAVQCPNCGASYQAAAGYTGRCPYCGSYHNVE